MTWSRRRPRIASLGAALAQTGQLLTQVERGTGSCWQGSRWTLTSSAEVAYATVPWTLTKDAVFKDRFDCLFTRRHLQNPLQGRLK
jgi:hypothetical protein